MTFKILSPEEAKKRARANVAEWLRQKEMEERRKSFQTKGIPETEKTKAKNSENGIQNDSRSKSETITKCSQWFYLNPDNPADLAILNRELHSAASHGTIKKANELLEQGANINYFDNEFGGTPLYWAVWHKKKKMVSFLLEKGADSNIICNGTTCLSIACTQLFDDTTLVKMLIDAGADVNAKVRYIHNLIGTALHAASRSAHPEIVKVLLLSGANIHQNDDFGHTAIMAAAQSSGKKSVETIECLIDAGVDINARNRNGVTALRFSHSKNKEILRRHGATK